MCISYKKPIFFTKNNLFYFSCLAPVRCDNRGLSVFFLFFLFSYVTLRKERAISLMKTGTHDCVDKNET